MKLLTIGDSFTYGDELPDRRAAWPVVLANKLGWTLTNLGVNSCSNTGMIRRVVEHIDQHDVIIVGWSHYDRLEVADKYSAYEIWPSKRNIPNIKECPWRAELGKHYTLYHNHEYAYRQYLINVILFQSLAQLKNKKYLMIDAFGNNTDRANYAEANADLISQIDTQHFVGWPSESMLSIAGDAPRTHSNTGHFLELGHQRVAERIADEIAKHIRH